MGVLQSILSDVEDDSLKEEVYDDPAQPTRIVRVLLSRLGLPMELVLDIMDLADYYPQIHASRDDIVRLRADAHTPRNYCSAQLYLVSPPIPSGQEGESWRIKKITWRIVGRDQGWGGVHPGTYNGAYSWYEACIFRPDPEEETDPADLNFLVPYNLYRKPSDVQDRLAEVGWSLVPNGEDFVWRVQSNRVAQREFQEHTVEWTAGEAMHAFDVAEHGSGDGKGFLEALRPGDRVGLWSRAIYSGWENLTKEAEIHVMYEVR